ncbi:YpiF family protein [Bacillus rubiinfantis]|uniref:YpiF family protein n=1 Tax=Bacillus rubiinfantis TaxID=1499680 RepID=UPI0005A7FC3A|nr:YpiF family protein [Bacillus rubiinfantis]
MKWISQDVETYLHAKEYVDTAVIPLFGVTVGDGMKESAAAAEFITLLTTYLERQFTGRIFMFPAFTYFGGTSEDENLAKLQRWEANLSAHFKHIIYVTSDFGWRDIEDKLHGTLLWLPAIPLEQMSDTQKIAMIDSQVKQLLTVFTHKWRENV